MNDTCCRKINSKMIYDIIISLVPVFIFAVYTFGLRAYILTSIAMLSCMTTEYICLKVMGREGDIFDGSAILIGILLAFSLPVNTPYQYIIIGCVVAIILGKMVFGGLGQNIFNPSLVGRTFIQTCWIGAITMFEYDYKSGATVLVALKNGGDKVLHNIALIAEGTPYIEAFIGRMGGAIGETSALAILIGGLYLIFRKRIDWKVPVIIITSVGLLTWLFGQNPLMHILSGGLFLGAFYFATDISTSPSSNKGRVIFSVLIGILISLIRVKGGMQEGVAYAILIANGVVPLIDRYFKNETGSEVRTNEK